MAWLHHIYQLKVIIKSATLFVVLFFIRQIYAIMDFIYLFPNFACIYFRSEIETDRMENCTLIYLVVLKITKFRPEFWYN